MEVDCAHLVGAASIMPRGVTGPGVFQGKIFSRRLRRVVASVILIEPPKNLDLAAWERAGVVRNVAAVV